MIPFSSWVRGLIASCAKTHETNNFTQPQNIKNGITIDSDSLSDGYKGYVKFTNNGDVAGVYGHVSAIGTKSVILKAGNKKLGLGITDEGFPWTYCEHPVEGGDNHQIATYGYVEDQLSDVNDDIDSLHSRVTKCEDDIADLQVVVGNLQVPSLVHEAIENDFTHAISSGGVYNALTALETRINKTIAKTCKEYIENALISGINFAKTKILSKDHKTTFTYTPTEPGIIVLGWHRGGHNLYFKQDGKEMKGNSYDYIGEYVNKGTGVFPITFALKAGVEYEWKADDGINYVFWTPLTFSIGEA